MRKSSGIGPSQGLAKLLGWLAAPILLCCGCGPEAEIVQYTVDTKMPDVLRNDTRLLGAIVPNDQDVWFFKLTGEIAATEQIETELREWVTEIQFDQGTPQLDLPDNWSQKPGSGMRFATIEIPVGDPPLEVSVTKLSKSEDWDRLVKDNVNRWRGQMGLESSDELWAGAETLRRKDSATPAIWVELTGELGGGTSMSAQPPFATGPQSPSTGEQPPATAQPSSSEPPIRFTQPESWKQGRTSSMRWAAFLVGPEEKSAEITVIPAGGDLRGNIQRWMGQIRPDGVTDEQVDSVIAEGKTVTVDGIESQRFLMSGSGEPLQAIDATIVPLGEGFSLFIKMTGDAETVAAESERIQQFLDSLKLNQ